MRSGHESPPCPLLCLVVAVADNGVIGRANALPWHLPADLAHFRRLTLDRTILMGRRTWESLPGPLPRRRHLVLTRDPTFQAAGCTPVGSLEAALAAAAGEAQLMIVGGASLYAQTLPRADRLYLTQVHAQPAGDTRFPPWTPGEWQEVARRTHAADERNPVSMTFLELHRHGSGRLSLPCSWGSCLPTARSVCKSAAYPIPRLAAEWRWACCRPERKSPRAPPSER